MFVPERSKLLEGLTRVQRRLCCYHQSPPDQPPNHCDCKYGAGMCPSGEDTGCPEVSAAIEIIHALRPEQYKQLTAIQPPLGDTHVGMAARDNYYRRIAEALTPAEATRIKRLAEILP